MREDLYQTPDDRYAHPTLLDAADFVIPHLESDPHLRLVQLTEKLDLFALDRTR